MISTISEEITVGLNYFTLIPTNIILVIAETLLFLLKMVYTEFIYSHGLYNYNNVDHGTCYITYSVFTMIIAVTCMCNYLLMIRNYLRLVLIREHQTNNLCTINLVKEYFSYKYGYFQLINFATNFPILAVITSILSSNYSCIDTSTYNNFIILSACLYYQVLISAFTTFPTCICSKSIDRL